MMTKSFEFILNYKSFPIPTKNKMLIDFPQEIFDSLVFDDQHKYEIKSNVSEDVLRSFINYLINEEPPEITVNNFYEYSELSREFNQLTDLIQSKQAEFGESLSFFKGLQSPNQETRSFCEDQISQHLDDYLKKFGKEILKLPIQTLHNIFNHPKRKLNDHNLAYTLINFEYKRSKNSNVYILIQSLEGEKLSRENLEDSIISRDLHLGMTPSIKTDFFAASIEQQNRIENQFIQLNEGFENQRKIIENLVNEIKDLKDDKIKKSSEIDELKNKIKTQEIQISEIEKKQKNEISLIQKNHLKDANELKEIIRSQTNEINGLRNTIKIQMDKLTELEKKHESDATLIQKNCSQKIDELNKKIKEKSIKQSSSNSKTSLNITQILYDSSKSNRFDGIINYLTKKCGGNVHKKGIVNLTSSSTLNNEYSPFKCVDLDDVTSCFESNSEPNSWLCFDFKEKKIKNKRLFC